MDIAYSKNGVPIRITDERWSHIVENHDELAGYRDNVIAVVENPEWITRGQRGSLSSADTREHARMDATKGFARGRVSR